MNQKYKIIRNVAEGSTSEVFKVVDCNSHPYALKRIQFHKNRLKQFQNQLLILSKFNHPNLLKFYEYFYEEQNQENQIISIILEYCNDSDLFNYIVNRTQYSQSQTILILKQIVLGCIALCDKGVIHRDLKLQNILLNGKVVKIGDFGSAKLISHNKKRQRHSFNIGTPLYSAPEVLNQIQYDQKSDVWSVGVILYCLIYNNFPFTLDSLIKLKFGQNKKKLQLPNFPQIDKQLEELLKGMLKYQKQQRLCWGQVINNRIFHKRISNIDKYLYYLVEINLIISWILQSLFDFQEFYTAQLLIDMIDLVNNFLRQNLELIKCIINKDSKMNKFFNEKKFQEYKPDKSILLKIHSFESKFPYYLHTFQNKRQHRKLNMQIRKFKSGRQYLWQAQKIVRKLIIKSYSKKFESISYKRSLYCLLIIVGFDRHLGEQHYLTLQSKQIINWIKSSKQSELIARIKIQIVRYMDC